MNDRTKKCENIFSDPSECNPLITELKKSIQNNPNDPKKWVELGAIYEQRLNLIDHITRHNFVLRHALILTVLGVSFLSYLYIQTGLLQQVYFSNPLLFFSLIAIIVLIMMLMGFVRYPRSGSRFFRKAIASNPKCGEAYMHLGLIALRRFQKRKGYRFLEHALQLNITDLRIKKELKILYEREFVKFFNTQKEKEKKQQGVIDSQLEEIKNLHIKQHLLETNIAILKTKTKQTRSKATQNIKIKAREMNSRMADFKQEYHEKIIEIDKEKITLAEKNDNETTVYVNLTDELFESQLKTDQLTFYQTTKNVKSTFELDLWQSLCRQTKFYLVTAEQTFSIFSKNDELKDFSLIGLEYCKALELEINKKFVIPFIEHIKEDKEEFLKLHQTGTRKNRPKYYGYLPMVVDENNYPRINSLTLGQFYFSLEQSLKNNYILQDYKRFINGLFSYNRKQTIQVLLNKLGIVVKRYRNAIAHQSSMNKEECEHVRNLIFSDNDSLLQICSMSQPISDGCRYFIH